MIDGLDAAVAKLRASADSLNALTDKIARSVTEVEAFLNDVCSAGVDAWAEVWRSDEQGAGLEAYTALVYRRIGGRFRIGVERGVIDFPEKTELKAWAECSRDLKLETAKALPELVRQVSEAIDDRIAVASETAFLATAVVATLHKAKEG